MQMLCIRYEALLDLSPVFLTTLFSIIHHMRPKATSTEQHLQFLNENAVDNDDDYDDTMANIFWGLFICYLNYM